MSKKLDHRHFTSFMKQNHDFVIRIHIIFLFLSSATRHYLNLSKNAFGAKLLQVAIRLISLGGFGWDLAHLHATDSVEV